jgi:uncharacterized protein DUF1839
MTSVLGLAEHGSYATHALHSDERTWPETNCYVDLWIAVLHSLGLDPMAGLAFTLAMDFEGDQYTFFKFQHNELRALYGIDVEELNPWRGLAAHAVEQVALGRFIMPEVDAFYLPDTAGVSYQIDHGKSSIAIAHIDVERRVLRYFHNRGYHTLEARDFDAIFRLGEFAPAPGVLPPYVEIAKLDRVVNREPRELARLANDFTRVHVMRRPLRNPIARHRDRLVRDLEWLKGEPLSTFHLYAFATVRQAGACFALTATYLRWLDEHTQRGGGLDAAAAAFDTISSTAKTVQFKLARMANLKREVDLGPLFQTMEDAWDAGMSRLVDEYGD